jgi:uncharacterized OB-fold protein
MPNKLRVFSCERCGTIRAEGFRFCGNCGSHEKAELEFVLLTPKGDGTVIAVKVDCET